jgi:predicted transcriptional regulator
MPKTFKNLSEFVHLYVNYPSMTMKEITEKLGVSVKAPYKWLRKQAVKDLIKAATQPHIQRKLYKEFMEGQTADRKLYLEYEVGWNGPTQKIDQTVKGEVEFNLSDVIREQQKVKEDKETK